MRSGASCVFTYPASVRSVKTWRIQRASWEELRPNFEPKQGKNIKKQNVESGPT